ncbi:winged helix-turn-helix transcriptional regulator [Embleya sp. NPDC008237]|uniref:winged helix-turn-helix transcriptional regulator n=1 Tax=Embleya sp. NPDC008237 TaxID=3363978 RepID=UPI0036F0A80C
MRYTDLTDADCAITQALGIVGDWWTLLLIRDVAAGVHQFGALHEQVGISRKVLAQRLKALVEHGVLEKRLYHPHPPRYEYHLTESGRGLLPVLVALQNWGSRHVLGDGTLTATGESDSAEARQAHALVGTRLPALTLRTAADERIDPIADTAWTVLYCFPGAYAPGLQGHPPGWDRIPGAPGCTLESCTYRDRLAEFTDRGATVRGVSTQRPDQLASFARHANIPFPLLSDADLELTAALRLPTFRAAGVDRLKRLTLLLDDTRTVRGVLYPLPDPAGSVEDALTLIDTRPTRTTRAGQRVDR